MLSYVIFVLAENETDTEEIERKIHQTDPHCVFASKPLFKFDLYAGTVVFAFQKSEQDLCGLFESSHSTENGELFYSLNDLDVVVRSSTSTCSTNVTIPEKPNDDLKCLPTNSVEEYSGENFNDITVSLTLSNLTTLN